MRPMDRAPLRGMVLNALILLYGNCQGWCRVRGGKDHTALASQTTPHKLRTNVRDNSRKRRQTFWKRTPAILSESRDRSFAISGIHRKLRFGHRALHTRC